MSLPAFNQFNLVGGTALSLQIGHRISIDLDLFSNQDFNNATIINALEPLGELTVLVDNPPFLQMRLDDVKLDFLKYPYPFIQNYTEIEGVRLVSIQDIGTMKLNAVARRGAKKDFFDLVELLNHFPLEEMIEFFSEKYRSSDPITVIRSLAWFEDAEAEPDPISLREIDWPSVKRTLSRAVSTF